MVLTRTVEPLMMMMMMMMMMVMNNDSMSIGTTLAAFSIGY
jgi:hypothetical protein